MNFDIVLIERPQPDGLTKGDIIRLFKKLGTSDFYPIEIYAGNLSSVAMGFIATKAADKLNYDYERSGLSEFIGEILDDMEKETEDGAYVFKGINIWLSR